MIDFEQSDTVKTMQGMVHAVAEQAMRPIAREYDEREHEKDAEHGAARGGLYSSRHTPCAVAARLVSRRHTECAYYYHFLGTGS